ncbi:DUF423 domain-containing protein [Aliidongia dinghuensis]|uniref:DUF423 domain-containing protein n=1 Tax=Aliidongia dinghuensis TaxID=1867774 RepID=UPI00166BEC1D|nr:DUF423 domain-containing protein [Aliidongia dinghuensis]
MAGKFLLAAGLGGAVGVAAGAVGTHVVADDHARQLVDLASRYLMIHAVALVGLAQVGRAGTGGWLVDIAFWLFLVGMVLFGGGLLVSATVGLGAFGSIVPIGGTAFILAWLVVAGLGLRRLAQ